jgi:hypothetical protein
LGEEGKVGFYQSFLFPFLSLAFFVPLRVDLFYLTVTKSLWFKGITRLSAFGSSIGDVWLVSLGGRKLLMRRFQFGWRAERTCSKAA